jgi:hypothetical protein
MRSAFAHRHDLLESALEDSDLVVLNAELTELAAFR